MTAQRWSGGIAAVDHIHPVGEGPFRSRHKDHEQIDVAVFAKAIAESRAEEAEFRDVPAPAERIEAALIELDRKLTQRTHFGIDEATSLSGADQEDVVSPEPRIAFSMYAPLY
jgi:hypothetical protein